MTDCLFCKIARDEIPAEKISETENFFAIRDIHPKAKGHTLIIPKKHFTTLLNIPKNLGNELLEMTKQVAAELLKQNFGNGFNVLMNNFESAGQLVKHAHLHIIPRNENDGLKSIA